MPTRIPFAVVTLGLATAVMAMPTLGTRPQTATPVAATTDLPEGKSIVQRSVDAIGSKAARDAVKSTEMKLTARTPMGTNKISLTLCDPNKVLMKQSLEGATRPSVEMGFDGAVGWMQTPNAPPRVLTPEMCAQFAGGADAQELARSLDTRFTSFKTLGAEQVEGVDSWRVQLVDSDGIASIGFFAKDTGLLRALDHMQDTPQGETVSRSVFDRWERVDGVMCCRKLSIAQSGAKQEISFDEIVFNKVAADAIRAPDALRASGPTPK